jgi:hypothetical protein
MHIGYFSIQRVRSKITIATLLAIGASASAQQSNTLTEQQCRDAISISTGIINKYGKEISSKFADSFVAFANSNCDLDTPFTRVEGTKDEDAFGEFRLRIIALRMQQQPKP